ncbi:MAG: radical SAM protein [Bacteroidales bacterium]|nr:radical SAM protein [Bacteroidales bacterium]
MKKHYNIPIFIPEAACPHQCIFCNQKNITENVRQPSFQDVIKTVERYLSTIPKGSDVEIAFFGGNFTGLPLSQQERYLQTAQKYIDRQLVSSIRCSTRPDYINEKNMELLLRYNVKNIELGAQSFDGEVLQRSGRGHFVDDIYRAVEILKAYKISFGLQMMTGLPGDTPEKSQKTATEIVRLQAENTRIYPCLVIKDTALERLFLEGKYQPQSINEAIELCKELTFYFESHNVKILRVGLHRSEGFDSGKTLIAGPYHPSFKELVETAIWRYIFEREINFSYRGNIHITIPKGTAGVASGHLQSNRKWLNAHFSSVRFSENERFKKREYHVDYC